MNSLLTTLLIVSVGLILITIALVYNMDAPQNKGKSWTQIMQEDIATRVIFGVAGGLALVYAAVGQFMH